MKRLMILAGAITMVMGTAIYAQDADKRMEDKMMGTSPMKMGKMHSGDCMDGMMDSKMDKESQKKMIEMMEKRLEIKKEMIKDTPDMKKVEELKKEIAEMRIEHREKMIDAKKTNN